MSTQTKNILCVGFIAVILLTVMAGGANVPYDANTGKIPGTPNRVQVQQTEADEIDNGSANPAEISPGVSFVNWNKPGQSGSNAIAFPTVGAADDTEPSENVPGFRITIFIEDSNSNNVTNASLFAGAPLVEGDLVELVAVSPSAGYKIVSRTSTIGANLMKSSTEPAALAILEIPFEITPKDIFQDGDVPVWDGGDEWFTNANLTDGSFSTWFSTVETTGNAQLGGNLVLPFEGMIHWPAGGNTIVDNSVDGGLIFTVDSGFFGFEGGAVHAEDITIDDDLFVGGSIGIGNSSPATTLDLSGSSGHVRSPLGFDVYGTGDSGYDFNGPSGLRSKLFTEANKAVISLGINSTQSGTRDNNLVGGLFRMDTRTGAGLAGGEQAFIIYGIPTGGNVPTPRMMVSLQDGTTLLVPNGGDARWGSTALGHLKSDGSLVVPGTTQLASGVGINVDPAVAPTQSFSWVGSSANGRDWFSLGTATSNGNGVYSVFGPYLESAGGDRSAQINITANHADTYAKFRCVNTAGAAMEVGAAGSGATFGGGSAGYMTTLGAYDLVLATNVTERMRLSASGASVTGSLTVTDDAYAGGWDGSLAVPTKNAVYDKIQSLSVTSGTYAPTLTNVANLDGSTAFTCQYMRVGNVVTVSGKVSVDPTAAASTELGISLPIASALTAVEQVGGTAYATGIAAQGAAITGDASNDRAQLQFISVDLTNQGMPFSFTYLIQ